MNEASHRGRTSRISKPAKVGLAIALFLVIEVVTMTLLFCDWDPGLADWATIVIVAAAVAGYFLLGLISGSYGSLIAFPVPVIFAWLVEDTTGMTELPLYAGWLIWSPAFLLIWFGGIRLDRFRVERYRRGNGS